MVNLLPQSAQKHLTRRYYLHAATLLLYFLAGALSIGGLLLIPSYFAARTSADSYERYRDALQGTVGLKERTNANDDVALLSERIRIMEYYVDRALVAEIIDALGERVSKSIAVTALSFTRTDTGATVEVSGSAATRQSLLDFVEAVRQSPSFKEVSLPVSQLVTEEHASFSIKMIFESKSP